MKETKHQKKKVWELERHSVESYQSVKKIPLFIVLDNVRSLNNIGAVFRTSDAFLVEKIFLCGITAQPPHRDIHKTALGATESVDWEYEESTLELVKKMNKQGIHTIAIEQTTYSTLLHDFKPTATQKYALIFGNEVKGVQQEVVDECENCIEIPQLGTKHSLNIAVTAGITIWDFFKSMKAE